MIIFFHIPKTAGTTFHSILDNEYRDKVYTIDGIKWTDSLNVLEKWKAKDFDKVDLIKGHLAFSLRHHPVLQKRKLIFVSYFRDPVKLFVSTYTYIKKQPLNRYHIQAKNMTLEEWIKFRKTEHLDNLQSRHLLEILPYFNPCNKNLSLNLSDQQELKIELISRLDKIQFVFSTDNFDTSLLFLKKELKWKETPYYVPQNISNSNNFIDRGLKEKIEEMNWLDMYLFKQVKELESKRFGFFNKYQEVKRFKNVNKYWTYLRYIKWLFR